MAKTTVLASSMLKEPLVHMRAPDERSKVLVMSPAASVAAKTA